MNIPIFQLAASSTSVVTLLAATPPGLIGLAKRHQARRAGTSCGKRWAVSPRRNWLASLTRTIHHPD